MIRSDAVPIQFWLIDCDTFNESEPYGINRRCWCHPWECNDEIKDQFQDEANQNFSLLVHDDEGELITSIPYEETSPGVYLIAFTPSDNTPDFCDRTIQLFVRREAGTQGVTLPAFNTWANAGGAGDPWTTGSNPSITLSAGGANSEYLFADFAFIVGVQYTVSINYNSSTVTLGAQISVNITDGSLNVQFSNGIEIIDTSGPTSTTPIVFTATSDTTRIAVRIIADLFDSVTITLTSPVATRSAGTAEVIEKSDCLSIKEEQVGTQLISYSNHRNYAGIINNNGSPDLTFHLRIPAVFNEERFPETDEPLQLSNNRIISLNSQVKKQRLLETDQMPNYMHLKTQQALKHQFVTIGDKDFVKEEPYEQVENANKRWPLRRYTCWLTEKEYVVRNIL